MKFRSPVWLLIMKATLDVLGIASSYALAFNLRFEGAVPMEYHRMLTFGLPILLVSRMVSLGAFTQYRRQWHSTGLSDLSSLVQATLLGSAIFVLVNHLVGVGDLPRSIVLLEFFFSINALISIRVLIRVLWNRDILFRKPASCRRVLVVGAGDMGQSIARLMKEDKSANLLPIGFTDDDSMKQRRRIYGLPVLGTISETAAVAKRRHVEQVVIAIASLPVEQMNHIVTSCARKDLEISIVPRLPQILNGQKADTIIRKVQVEDLLERSPVEMDAQLLSSFIQGHRVLVTGAGGSIGSELCRQIATCGPEKLIILGHGENSIFWIEKELREDFGLTAESVIADIKDRVKLEQVFACHRPTVVFHAAAHKHVPLMEQNPESAIKNNVFGTLNLAELAIDYGVKRFVMISTDKAVNPTSVMGASKRVAEMVVQSFAQQIEAGRSGGRAKGATTRVSSGSLRADTVFASVRFGNVLGSRGSVIPSMQRQIENGGPVTVTHPEMVRYFMTIPEAVQLVIQAGAMARDGEVFVLDMGKPVKIMDLAKNLIRLSGFMPDRDIPIQITGIRPGEKLYEEVLTAEEGVTATTHEKIFVARSSQIEHKRLQSYLMRLESAAKQCDRQRIRCLLADLVPSYRSALDKPSKEMTMASDVDMEKIAADLEQAEQEEQDLLHSISHA